LFIFEDTPVVVEIDLEVAGEVCSTGDDKAVRVMERIGTLDIDDEAAGGCLLVVALDGEAFEGEMGADGSGIIEIGYLDGAGAVDGGG